MEVALTRLQVLGCMAERLKERLLESDRLADIVAGPDAYRDLPRLLAAAQAIAHILNLKTNSYTLHICWG